MLLTGPSIHLWFLPFAFAASLALYPVARLRVSVASQIVLLIILTFVSLGLVQNNAWPIPLPQWSFGLAGVFAGVAVALAHNKGLNTALTLLPFAIVCAAAVVFGWTTGLLQLALATVALLLCMKIHSPDTALSHWAAEVSMGVYLIHPLVTSVLQRTIPLAEHSLLMAFTTMAGALLLAEALRAFRQKVTSSKKHTSSIQ